MSKIANQYINLGGKKMDLKQIENIVRQTNQEQLDTAKRISELANALVELRKLEAETIDQLRMLTNNLTVQDTLEDKMIETLGLSTRTFNCLTGKYRLNKENPLRTIRDILNVPKYGWHKIIGPDSKTTAKEIEEKMHKAGFTDFKIRLSGYKANLVN